MDGPQASHGDALAQYLHAFRCAPQHPLTLLCLAVAFLNQVLLPPPFPRDAPSLAIGVTHCCFVSPQLTTRPAVRLAV